MKALTISQPYASLIASGEKFVENRSWETRYRGPLAIHAGKGTQYLSRTQIRNHGLPFGQIVAIAELQGCVNYRQAREGRSDIKLPPWLTLKAFLNHEHTEGEWCWILGDVRKLSQPIDVTGKQGLWDWEGHHEPAK